MTKEEAISLMKAGHKLTHRYFTSEEWVKTDETGMIYILEDGVECSHYEFWHWRKDESWNTGWELFEGN
jgi:hypothetical protein